MEITGYWGMLEKEFGRVGGRRGSGWENISKLQIENDAIEQLPYYLPGPFGFRSGGKNEAIREVPGGEPAGALTP
jgi:hypothetical protein